MLKSWVLVLAIDRARCVCGHTVGSCRRCRHRLSAPSSVRCQSRRPRLPKRRPHRQSGEPLITLIRSGGLAGRGIQWDIYPDGRIVWSTGRANDGVRRRSRYDRL